MKINKKMFAVFLVITALFPMASYSRDKGSVTDSVKDVSKNVVETASDAAITTKIKTLFAVEHDVPSLNISVSTKNHVVYLSGKVHTPSQAHKIIEIAQSVKSVTEVDDSALNIVNNSSYLEDAMITARVKGKILQLAGDGEIANGYSLSVYTADGGVHIHGKVAKRGDIAHIEKVAHSVKNVKNVHTNIDIAKR